MHVRKTILTKALISFIFSVLLRRTDVVYLIMKYYFVSYHIVKDTGHGTGRTFYRDNSPYILLTEVESLLSTSHSSKCVVIYYKEISEEEFNHQTKNL